MYIDYEKIGKILGFGKRFFYNKKIKQNYRFLRKQEDRYPKPARVTPKERT